MSQFGSDYYLRGKEMGLSLYENYTWRPEMTEPAAQAVIDMLHPSPGETILDYGCARGYLVRALRARGVSAWGLDISEWATGEGADEEAGIYLSTQLGQETYDFLVAKDVFEHIPELVRLLVHLSPRILRGALIVVPLTEVNGGAYIEPDEEKDVTHCVRLSAFGWLVLLRAAWPIWDWTMTYRVPGIKDHRFMSKGYGFFIGKAPR